MDWNFEEPQNAKQQEEKEKEQDDEDDLYNDYSWINQAKWRITSPQVAMVLQ